MAESYYDMTLEPSTSTSDISGPRSPSSTVLRIVDPDTGLRGKPKTATERLKHHLSVYERIAAALDPADIKQLLELTEAILQDAKDLATEAQETRSAMLASILGVSPKSISRVRLEKLIGEIAG